MYRHPAGHKYELNKHREQCARGMYMPVYGSTIQASGLPPDVIPLLPEWNSFKYKIPCDATYGISRSQLPLVPAYAFTVNKRQGQSLENALVDLRSTRGTQALYVMISRAVSLQNLGIMCWLPSTNIDQRLSPT